MNDAKRRPLFRISVHVLVLASGVASLSWEVLWQIKASLALGVSAWGTALTLATMMGGMCIGSLACGHVLMDKGLARPARLYGVFELVIGIAGLFLGAAFEAVAKLDTLTYAHSPASAPFVHVLGIVASLGIPAICMGATLPVFGLMARQFRTSIALLYGLNTLGAALGALLAAFLLIPQLGITHTAWVISGVDFAVGVSTWFFAAGKPIAAKPAGTSKAHSHELSPSAEFWTVAVTGFATFMLEVSWFRSLTAAFQSTTYAFAVMLAAVLIALGFAAALVPVLKKMKLPLGSLISWAGIGILLATPLVERVDLAALFITQPVILVVNWFVITLGLIGPPVMLLGMAFPWILDDQSSPRRWGRLYALSTMSAIVGSIGAAWIFLPALGFARTAWIAGSLVAITGIVSSPRQRRPAWIACALAALLIAGVCESGVGVTRVQGRVNYGSNKANKILGFFEGPDATISVVQYMNDARRLIINGSSATGQSGKGDFPYEHYMAWMGYLPMLLDPDPKNALVICFGTGQTANAVRRENPQTLDIVDINKHVFELASNFTANEDVLKDPRVRAIVMDGRAYMRRTTKSYDVITLEPMPPYFTGVNALYSREFYELARQRLAPHGVIAQWLPYFGLELRYSASIAKTFQSVFPNAILWVDEISHNGILLGSIDDGSVFGMDWPGFARNAGTRNLSSDVVRRSVKLNRRQLEIFGSYGEVITDDNQLLAYGNSVNAAYIGGDGMLRQNSDALDRISKQGR